jgi:hypothetical protein
MFIATLGTTEASSRIDLEMPCDSKPSLKAWSMMVTNPLLYQKRSSLQHSENYERPNSQDGQDSPVCIRVVKFDGHVRILSGLIHLSIAFPTLKCWCVINPK